MKKQVKKLQLNKTGVFLFSQKNVQTKSGGVNNRFTTVICRTSDPITYAFIGD
jgi:hypothetical protein